MLYHNSYYNCYPSACAYRVKGFSNTIIGNWNIDMGIRNARYLAYNFAHLTVSYTDIVSSG